MFGLSLLFAYDREELMVAALTGLVVAGAVVAIGAWLLFFRDARRRVASRKSDDLNAEAGSAVIDPAPAAAAEVAPTEAEAEP